jgi:hypothetical protein
MEPWRVNEPMVTDSHHYKEKLDPDPHLRKLDPDPHYSDKPDPLTWIGDE